MHYLITGHTGFKGAWLTLWLTSQGHRVSGLSLDPAHGSLYESANVAELVDGDLRLDIRDASSIAGAVASVGADAVIHMAAQPLVRESYRDPRYTFETNVMGTLNVLQAVTAAVTTKALLVVTTDKVYRNVNRVLGYTEQEPLGGDDPYSSSKAMADILARSWATSFPGVPTAIARAGNVIGGGDVSPDRLIPDLIGAYSAGRPAMLRYPDAVRPWQHVLDCLSGYATLTDALLRGEGVGEWNFGPGIESFVPVGQVANIVADLWGHDASWTHEGGQHLHEANLLALDATKAQSKLGWSNRLPFPKSLEWTVDWYRSVSSGTSTRQTTLEQVRAYDELA